MNSLVPFVALIGSIQAAVFDTDCTKAGAYTAGAVSCLNVQADKFCTTVYPTSMVAAGANAERPLPCFGTAALIDKDLKDAAIATCPKTCGYCCKTKAFTCENARFPFQACETISPQQCIEPTWRPLIERDCPATCGFCNMGGCIDTAPFCNKQHCRQIGLEKFVAENCKRTCDLCSTNSTTTASTTCVDVNRNCAAWTRNGFCTNTFYTDATRRANCRRFCGLC